MTNLLSYCGLVDARISASEKDLPVQIPSTIVSSSQQDIHFPNQYSPSHTHSPSTIISPSEQFAKR